MAGFVGAKAVGLAREVIIARTFGTSAQLDAYYAAFNLPDLLFTLIAGGALATAFIPVFAEYLTRGDQVEVWKLASAVTNLVFLSTTVLAGAAALGAPWLVATAIAPGFTPQQQALTVDLMRLILVSTLIFGISGIQMGILNAYQHFLLPAIAPICYNLGIIGGAVFLAPRLGIYGLAVGVVVGATLHLLVKIPGLIHFGLRYFPVLGLSHPGVLQVLALLGPRVVALGVVKVNLLVTTNLASRLDEGSISALNFGWLIMQLPETIFATAVATAVFPTLAELAARGQRDPLRETLSGTLRAILFLTIPASIGLIVLGRPLIQIVFEGGRFGRASTEAVYVALQFYALGLVGHSTLEIVARTFYAQKDTRTPLMVAATAMLANIGLSIVLLDRLGHGGLALANSLAVTFEVGSLFWLLHRRLGGVEGMRLWTTVRGIGLASAAMAIAVVAFTSWLGSGRPLLAGLGGIALGGAVYLGGVVILGVEEVRALPRRVLGRSQGVVD